MRPEISRTYSWPTCRCAGALRTSAPYPAPALRLPVGDENTIIGDTEWPLGGVTGRIAGDVLNFHPYPVLFTPTKGDGFFDAVTQAGPTFDGSFVRAFGPSFMQEWGTLVTGGVAQQDAYLRRILPESLGNGVCG